jgi:hypothetical protein
MHTSWHLTRKVFLHTAQFQYQVKVGGATSIICMYRRHIAAASHLHESVRHTIGRVLRCAMPECTACSVSSDHVLPQLRHLHKDKGAGHHKRPVCAQAKNQGCKGSVCVLLESIAGDARPEHAT